MLKFYKKALLVLFVLLCVSTLATYLCLKRTFLELSLLPANNSKIPWHAEGESDAGPSSVKIHDENFSLDFELFVSKNSDKIQHPFASVALPFTDPAGQPTLVDLSSFDSLSFSVKCSPANILTFIAFTFDENVTIPGNFITYRIPSSYFSCDESWRHLELDLTRLEVPQWWLSEFDLELSMKDYELDKVPRILFGSSFQSPREVSSRIQLNQLTLNGHDWRYIYLLGSFLFVAWSACGIWLFRQHTRAVISDLRKKLQKDRPLVAYQQLSMEPQRDRDKYATLRFMATEYANPDLTLDTMVTSIGVSRTKINDVLRAELGFTFTGYLNKLRLAEAARLLADTANASIAEIAYSVGYRNVSYFNKLFKEEYGCTPKIFKGVYKKTQ